MDQRIRDEIDRLLAINDRIKAVYLTPGIRTYKLNKLRDCIFYKIVALLQNNVIDVWSGENNSYPELTDYFNEYADRQDEALSCGRSALNNAVGFSLFIKNDEERTSSCQLCMDSYALTELKRQIQNIFKPNIPDIDNKDPDDIISLVEESKFDNRLRVDINDYKRSLMVEDYVDTVMELIIANTFGSCYIITANDGHEGLYLTNKWYDSNDALKQRPRFNRYYLDVRIASIATSRPTDNIYLFINIGNHWVVAKIIKNQVMYYNSILHPEVYKYNYIHTTFSSVIQFTEFFNTYHNCWSVYITHAPPFNNLDYLNDAVPTERCTDDMRNTEDWIKQVHDSATRTPDQIKDNLKTYSDIATRTTDQIKVDLEFYSSVLNDRDVSINKRANISAMIDKLNAELVAKESEGKHANNTSLTENNASLTENNASLTENNASLTENSASLTENSTSASLTEPGANDYIDRITREIDGLNGQLKTMKLLEAEGLTSVNTDNPQINRNISDLKTKLYNATRPANINAWNEIVQMLDERELIFKNNANDSESGSITTQTTIPVVTRLKTLSISSNDLIDMITARQTIVCDQMSKGINNYKSNINYIIEKLRNGASAVNDATSGMVGKLRNQTSAEGSETRVNHILEHYAALLNETYDTPAASINAMEPIILELVDIPNVAAIFSAKFDYIMQKSSDSLSEAYITNLLTIGYAINKKLQDASSTGNVNDTAPRASAVEKLRNEVKANAMDEANAHVNHILTVHANLLNKTYDTIEASIIAMEPIIPELVDIPDVVHIIDAKLSNMNADRKRMINNDSNWSKTQDGLNSRSCLINRINVRNAIQKHSESKKGGSRIKRSKSCCNPRKSRKTRKSRKPSKTCKRYRKYNKRSRRR